MNRQGLFPESALEKAQRLCRKKVERVSDSPQGAGSGCPCCGKEEVEAYTPRTVYSCGSSGDMRGEKGVTLPDPADTFAQVELYRWQHGELPEHSNEKPLDVSAGLEGMSNAIREMDMENFPSPDAIITVLDYVAKLLRKSNAQNQTEGASQDDN